jgi:hypothetical protein
MIIGKKTQPGKIQKAATALGFSFITYTVNVQYKKTRKYHINLEIVDFGRL